jgi:hemin uptake protein HemP
MNPQTPSEASNPRFYTPRPPRQRVSTTNLMRGSRELILVHEGEEYILRTTTMASPTNGSIIGMACYSASRWSGS